MINFAVGHSYYYDLDRDQQLYKRKQRQNKDGDPTVVTEAFCDGVKRNSSQFSCKSVKHEYCTRIELKRGVTDV